MSDCPICGSETYDCNGCPDCGHRNEDRIALDQREERNDRYDRLTRKMKR